MADSPGDRVDFQFEWDDNKAASNLEKHAQAVNGPNKS